MITIYPKRLALTAIFLVVFGVLLSTATDVKNGATAVGLFAVLAYVAIEVFASWNPAVWSRRR
jgi:hypothetical protein